MISGTFSRNAIGWLALATATGLLAAGCKSVDARQYNRVGVEFFEQGLYSAAKVSFQESLFNDPNNPDTYYNLASAHHRLGDVEEAERFYNQALDRNPAHRRSYHSLAVLLVEQGRNDDALALLEGWVEDMPAAPQASVELAWLYRHVGDVASAEQQLQYALERSPRHGEALALLGSIREEQGQPGRALALYQRSLTSGRYHPEIASRVARLRTQAGGRDPLAAPPSRMVQRTDAPAVY